MGDGTSQMEATERPHSSDSIPEQLPAVEKTHTNNTSNTVFTLGPPPNGGFTAWAQVAAGLFCSFNSWGLVNSFGVFQQHYGHDILPGESPSRISWIGTMLGMLSFLGASFFGFMIDKGLARYMCVTACVVSSFSWMMLSLSTKYYQFMLTQGVLTGLCSSVLFSCGISAVAPYFSTRRGIALGITATGSSLGGIIYSVVTQKLLNEAGFAWTCRANGFILLATGVSTGILFKPRVNHLKASTRGYFAHECLTEPAFMAYCFGMLFAFIGFYIFYDYLQSYAFTFDANDSTFQYLTAIVNVGSLIGRLIPSYLVDKIGIFNVLIPGCFGSAILSFCWIAAKNKAGIIIVGIIYGIFSAPITVAPGVVAAKLTTNMNRLGIWVSFSFLFFGLGILFGAPFAGMIVRKHGYLGAQLYCGFAWIAAGILFTLSRHFQLGHEQKKVFVKC